MRPLDKLEYVCQQAQCINSELKNLYERFSGNCGLTGFAFLLDSLKATRYCHGRKDFEYTVIIKTDIGSLKKDVGF